MKEGDKVICISEKFPQWKTTGEEDYISTPISVLRYISELEKEIEKNNKL